MKVDRVWLEVAFRYPEKVRKLVLIDAAGFGSISRWGSLLLQKIQLRVKPNG